MKRPLFKSPIVKDPVNRPLAEDEKQNHLPQKKRSPCVPWYQLSVIRMNSTFLECPDVVFGHKGMIIILMIPLLLIIHWFVWSMVYISIERWSTYPADEQQEEVIFFIILFVVVGLLSWVILWLITRDCFRYTHYPMRFNRKTRKVYKYRFDGTVMVEDWDKLYFSLTDAPLGDRKVSAFRLAEDRDTVLEGLVLPFYADKDEDFLLSQWEFVRRYMEEPEELPHLAGQVEHIMDIYDRRETWLNGFRRLMIAHTSGVTVLAVISAPLVFILSIGRWLATQTCTIPVWPEEVEKECQIEPDDPYLRDRDHLAAPGTVPKPAGARR